MESSFIFNPCESQESFMKFCLADLKTKRIKRVFIGLVFATLLFLVISFLRFRSLNSENIWISMIPFYILICIPFLIIFLSYLRWHTKVIFEHDRVLFSSFSVFNKFEIEVSYPKVIGVGFLEGDMFFHVIYDGGKWYNSFTASSFKVYFSDRDQLLKLLRFLNTNISDFSNKVTIQHLNLTKSKIKNLENVWEEVGLSKMET